MGRALAVAMGIVEDEPWMAFALCRDMDPGIFFPRYSNDVLAAQRVCRQCPVREACLEYALSTRQDHGVWGGTSERERRKILRMRRLRAAG